MTAIVTAIMVGTICGLLALSIQLWHDNRNLRRILNIELVKLRKEINK